ncbi:Soc-like capsid decoration protein [Klebsiella phage Metamorpho]|nr:Soc-like capsid decoration protein [Klebsiella phage Metamorpho]
MAYVNIKTFDHAISTGTVKGTEVSVAFKVYSDSHRIADAQYQIFPSEKPAYATVIEDAAAWATANANMFKAEATSGGE